MFIFARIREIQMYLLSATSATVELELRVRVRQLQDLCVVSVCECSECVCECSECVVSVVSVFMCLQLNSNWQLINNYAD